MIVVGRVLTIYLDSIYRRKLVFRKLCTGEHPFLFCLFAVLVDNMSEAEKEICRIEREANNHKVFKRKDKKKTDLEIIRGNDKHFHNLLVKTKKELLKANSARRLTKTLFLTLPIFKAIQGQYHAMPRCLSFLERECETIGQFNRRKLENLPVTSRYISPELIQYYKANAS